MRTVFSLVKRHQLDPSFVELVQQLTLDQSRPHLGLKGSRGLYGGPEWWRNLESGVIPKRTYEGVIVEVRFTGMHNENKAFTAKLRDGDIYSYTCIANNKRDLRFFREGAKIKVTTFEEEMKNGSMQENVLSIEVSDA